MYMKFINFPLFIASLSIGLFVAYISTPAVQVIYVYPNPDNEDKVSFLDFISTNISSPEVNRINL